MRKKKNDAASSAPQSEQKSYMLPLNQPIFSADDALAILRTQDCTVTLAIATGTYNTDHNDTSFDLIYVKGLEEYVHFHNIKSIRCLNINKSDPGAEFIDIDWSTDSIANENKGNI